jgi:hypothetical protein
MIPILLFALMIIENFAILSVVILTPSMGSFVVLWVL